MEQPQLWPCGLPPRRYRRVREHFARRAQGDGVGGAAQGTWEAASMPTAAKAPLQIGGLMASVSVLLGESEMV